MADQKRLFLIDAYAMIYRAYYAFIKNPRITSTGLNTSAILGFVNTLDELLREQQPTHIAVAFDLPEPTFRHQLFPKYKAQRPPSPEAIHIAVPYIRQILDAYHIPCVDMPGYEADDVIGTLAKFAEKEGFTVYMMTSDKDYYQLVSENIFVFKPGRGSGEVEIVGMQEVAERFNVQDPKQVIDILAIWGDASDNVPGIQGIGEKTAPKLIAEYGSLENLLANVDKLTGKQKDSVIASKDFIHLSKHLVTIALDVPVQFDAEFFRLKEPDKDALKQIFEDLEFRTLARRLLPEAPQSVIQQPVQTSLFGMVQEVQVQTTKYDDISTVAHNYTLVDNAEKRAQLIETLQQLPSFCFDTETTGLDVLTDSLVGIAFSCKPHEAWYVPIPKEREKAQAVVSEFKPVFENPAIQKVGQNIKFDIQMLLQYGIDVEGELFDTMLAHYLLQPEMQHNMDYLAEQYLSYKPVSIEELIGKKGTNQTNMQSVNIERIKEYAGEDADVTWQLKLLLEKKLVENKMFDLFRDVEAPLSRVLAHVERSGFKLDIPALNESAALLTTDILAIEDEITKMVGFSFNISSAKQLGEILFDKLKIIDNPKLTKTKQYSTNEQELAKLKDKHPIIEKILDYRSLRKLLSTYVEALPLLINAQTGKVHTSFNQAVTSTGRLSSNNPNLQNIPIKTERGREIRKAFIPSDNEHLILSADYSQIELRLMADMSGDENMITAFRNNEDIHTATAAKIFNIPIGEVTREMRSKAKSANFGIIYGISSFGLSENLNISRSEAKNLIDSYFASYPGVKIYMDERIAFARKYEYVETILGRKRYLTEINSRNPTVRGFAERNAINAPVQGSAADVIKVAMINIFNQLNREGLKTKMILQVHDELVFDVYKPELETVKALVKFQMENAVNVSVPLLVEVGVGNNWLEAH